MLYKGRFCAKTDKGLVRKTNEDQAVALINPQGDIVMFVCDGMGGEGKGEHASKIAADIITESFKFKIMFMNEFSVKRWIDHVIKKINYEIYTESQDSEMYRGMGTTICLVFLFQDKLFIANAGDSRCYKVLSDKVLQITRDQTYVEYQLSMGEISEDEKQTSPNRHALMNYIGQKRKAQYVLNVLPNEKKTIILCSDGLYNNVSDKQIFSTVKSMMPLDEKVNTLIGIANSNGGTDNIAIAMWEPSFHA